MPIRSETGKAKRPQSEKRSSMKLRELVPVRSPVASYVSDPHPARLLRDLRLQLVTWVCFTFPWTSLGITNPEARRLNKIGKHNYFCGAQLRQDILDEHIKHKPGSRQWGVAALREDRESRRVIEIDENMLLVTSGRIYESQEDSPRAPWSTGSLRKEKAATR